MATRRERQRRLFGCLLVVFLLDGFHLAIADWASFAPSLRVYLGPLAALLVLVPIFVRRRHVAALQRLETHRKRWLYAWVGASVVVALATIALVAATNNAGYAAPGLTLMMATISGAYFALPAQT